MTPRRQGSPNVVRKAGQNVFLDVLRRPLGAISIIYLTLAILLSVLAPVIAPYSPVQQILSASRQGPSAEHLLGTDLLGRDILSRLLYGGQESLIGVAQALVVALVIAVPLGITAGYFGGWFDRVVTRVVDFMLSLPNIIVALSVIAIFANSMSAAMITYGILASATIIRVVRSSVLGVREELFIDAAKTIGLNDAQILVRHVFPRTLGVVIVQTAMLAAITLGVQTGLAFLGFGPPPPAPTLGGMVGEASAMLQIHMWMIVPTAGVIALTTLAFGLLGDAIRDAYGERLTRLTGRPESVKRAEAGVDVVRAPVGEPDENALLSIRGLTVVFGHGDDEKVVLDGIDFDVQPGETVGLVGESGSGKTVTALSVLGLLSAGGRVVSGEIWFGGEEITHFTPDQFSALRGAEIALISQEPMVALDPAFKVGFQIAEAVRAHEGISWTAARKRAVELLSDVRMPDPQHAARLFPHQISGGMAQRVAIAMALAGKPRLLVADEPTTALDVTVQAEILDLLRALRRDTGMSMLFVTHDWGVVADICDRAVVMYAGQVVEQAAVRDIFASPLHPYTQGLRASNPNLVVKGEPLKTIGGTVPPPGSWPQGCHFAPRCSFATEACRENRIEELYLGDDRSARCIRLEYVNSPHTLDADGVRA